MKILKIIGFFLLLSTAVFAQKDLGKTITMESEILGETRELQIVLPDDFKPEEKRYSVIYVTDGEKRTNMTKSVTDFIKYAKMMPESIIVGIINIDRRRDFTPSKIEGSPTSGKAALFLSYLEKEVKPYIISNYGSKNRHILTGHSLGGLFSMYTFLTKPTLFDAYIASDPSFWWDNEFMHSLAKKNLTNLKGEQHVLFINGRDGDPMNTMGIATMRSILEKHAPDNLDWKVTSYPNETHTSVVFKGYYDGLRFVEQEYSNNNIAFHPRNANMVKDKPIMMFVKGNTEGLYYTINGDEPTETATKYKKFILADTPGVVKVKKISKRKNGPKAKSIEVKLSSPIKAITGKEVKKLKNGLAYEYYEGSWDKLPNFKSLKSTEKGEASSFELKAYPRTINFGCTFDGYFEAKTAGYYYFIVKAGEGLKFYIGDFLVVDYNKIREKKLEASGVVYLEKGLHPVTMEYFQKENKKKIDFKFFVPGVTKGIQKMPFDLFYH